MSAPAVHRRRRRAAPAADRGRALTILAIVGVLLVIGMAADIMAAPPTSPAPDPLPQDAAAAGTWYCPSVAREGETSVLTIAAVGDEASRVVVARYGKGRATPDKPRTVQPGAVVTLEATGDVARAPSAVQWTGGPVAVHWRVDGSSTAAAPCETAPSERWYVAGFNTDLGSTGLLHLFNPFTSDAVVRLVFAEPEGEKSLVLTDNVLVGAGKTTSIKMRRFMPEKPDLGVTVEVLSGRVIAQGEQIIDPPGQASGASGRLLLRAAPSTSESWSFASAVDTEETESWLTVMNPNDDEAAVEVRVSSPSQDASSFVGEVSVPAGGLSRIELAKVSKADEFGVTVNAVNGQPVVATRQTALSVGGRIHVYGELGAPQPDDAWALLGGGTAGRTGRIALYNPGAEAVTVDVAVQGAPDNWRGVVLAPNARAALKFGSVAQGVASLPVIARGDGPFVADFRSTSLDEQPRLWSNVGVAEALWVGPTTRPPVARDPSLGTHAGQAPDATEDVLFPGLDDSPAEVPTGAPDPAPTTGDGGAGGGGGTDGGNG